MDLQRSTITCTSEMSGTFSRTQAPSIIMLAASTPSTAFLLPLIFISPRSGWPPVDLIGIWTHFVPLSSFLSAGTIGLVSSSTFLTAERISAGASGVSCFSSKSVDFFLPLFLLILLYSFFAVYLGGSLLFLLRYCLFFLGRFRRYLYYRELLSEG